jgi:hypothetical protein
MKNNLAAQWAARAGTTNSLSARWAIWAALNGDVKRLAERLRKRRASPEEMEFAADLIERKVKPRRPRRGQPSLLTNDEIAQAYFHLRARHPDWRRKRIIGTVAAIFGLQAKYDRHVYNVLERLDPERRNFYEKQARVIAAYIAGKPNLQKAFIERRLRFFTDKDTGQTTFLEFFARTPRVLREGSFARK